MLFAITFKYLLTKSSGRSPGGTVGRGGGLRINKAGWEEVKG